MTAKCPICRKPVEEGVVSRPFCSARCKDVDLGRWLNEEYRISRPMTPGELASELAASSGSEEAGDLRRDFEYDA